MANKTSDRKQNNETKSQKNDDNNKNASKA